MKKIWSKKRFQRAGHSSRTFGSFTHVFRLCRKQSNDSDHTEDESGEPRVSMEMKEQSTPPQGQAVDSRLTSSGKTVVSHIPCDGLVVERELRVLGSRAPGFQDPLPPAQQTNAVCVESPPVRHLGVEALVRASQISVYYPAVGSEESMSLTSDNYGSVFSLYRRRTFSIYSAQE
ncbi:striated muscle preferentially expressed protein kinase [Myxocyprinus asiaticus]|uniref:striated muscle preferentially expressed protein kinase n=1 Tax=Myxocyprinus asiaticus TaxID=70543 RepID=UPI0022237951|nr:striated muscle preferentially expressed protein kinase [Myxocyprinus asiaticus]